MPSRGDSDLSKLSAAIEAGAANAVREALSRGVERGLREGLASIADVLGPAMAASLSGELVSVVAAAAAAQAGHHGPTAPPAMPDAPQPARARSRARAAPQAPQAPPSSPMPPAPTAGTTPQLSQGVTLRQPAPRGRRSAATPPKGHRRTSEEIDALERRVVELVRKHPGLKAEHIAAKLSRPGDEVTADSLRNIMLGLSSAATQIRAEGTKRGKRYFPV